MVFIQLAEHCKQATTETLTTETIFVIVRLTISILIVVGTCHGPPRPCEPPACRGPRGKAAALRARGKAASCRGKATCVSACRGEAALRPALRAGTASN